MPSPARPDPDTRTITYVRLDDVPEAVRNPKGHDLALLAASIAAHGFTAPAILDERTGRLVAGHGRLHALRQMHATGKPRPDGVGQDDGHWTIPLVRGWASADDAHADALIIADNKLTEVGGWDDRLLAEVLEDVADHSVDLLHLTGFTGDDLDRLIADTAPASDVGSDADDLPELAPGPPVAAPGQVWELGGHRLGVGAPDDAGLLAAVMGGKKAACLWTAAPAGDPETFAAAIANAGNHLRPGSPAYVAHPPGAASIAYGQALVDAGWSLRQQLLWVRDTPLAGPGDYAYRHQPIWLAYTPAPAGSGRLGRGGVRWYGDDSQATVAHAPNPTRVDLYPTAQPVELLTTHLGNSLARGGLVLDPFAGVGHTVIAAQALGQRARVLVEDPRYADLIVRRWQALTGGTATPQDRAGVAA